MKKTAVIKRVLCASFAVMLCVMLCSCDKLDELRAKHAVWTDNKLQALTYNGTEYVYASYTDLTLAKPDSTVNITNKDVPVLLSQSGSRGQFNKQYNIILYNGTVYAEKGKEDAIASMLSYPYTDLTNYGRYCRIYNKDEGYVYELVSLPRDIVSIINETLQDSSAVVSLDDQKTDEYELYYVDGAEFYRCDGNCVFMDYVTCNIMTDENNKNYYITMYDGNLYKIGQNNVARISEYVKSISSGKYNETKTQ